jgi:hypothetical protein
MFLGWWRVLRHEVGIINQVSRLIYKIKKPGDILNRHKPLPLNENLRVYATEMRKNPTDEEKKIWYGYLRHLKPNFHR